MIFLSRRDFASSDVVGRGVTEHTRFRTNRASRGLPNLRDEDLRLLNVLTSRALERLD